MGELQFIPGNTRNCLRNWESITSDAFVLQLAKGIPLEFVQEIPSQYELPRYYNFNAHDKDIIDLEVKNLVERKIVSEIEEGWKFVSNIFIRPKPNNKFRLIIDLSPLNAYIHKEHFKMDNLNSAIDLMSPNSFLASIDLKDAYYTLPIAEFFQPYICFQWDSKIYMFHVMPFGLTSAPRYFTKILKPPMSCLRKKGVRVFNYIDDLFIIGETERECEQSVKEVVSLLTKLGFFVNYEKSSLRPCTSMRFLGFILDTSEMTVYPPQDKVQKTLELLQKFLIPGTFQIREVASLVGVLNDLTQGVDYSKAHIKGLETDKNIALTQSGHLGFEGVITLSSVAKDDLYWWLLNLEGSCRLVSVKQPTLTVQTDASLQGWGAVSHGRTVNGKWDDHEKSLHINALETLAVLRAMKVLFPNHVNTHFKVLSDNTTTIAYINKAGGTWSYFCNLFSKQLWEWCQKTNNWISATHIPGVENVKADFASRHFTEDTEWGLNVNIFQRICERWFVPQVDLFASFNNHLLPQYVSWGPDPGSIACDAFLLNWKDFNSIFVFPPFRIVLRCVKKIMKERPKGILIVPDWPGQVWYADVMKLAIKPPMFFPKRSGNLVPKCKGNIMSNLHVTPLVSVRF